jgi:hypothetical protein
MLSQRMYTIQINFPVYSMNRSSLQQFVKNSNVQIVRDTPRSTSSSIDFNKIVGGTATPSPRSVSSSSALPNFTNPAFNDSPVKVGKLRVGMYNGLANGTFDDTNRVDLYRVLSKKPLPPQRLESGLVVDVREINGIYGRFQKGMTITRNKGFQGQLSDRFFTVQFKITVSKGNIKKDVSFNIYKNGKIRMSGGILDENNSFEEPDDIKRHIIDTYTTGQRFLYAPLAFNNLSGTVLTGAIYDLPKVARMMNASYEPELIDLLYYQKNGIKYVFARTGVIQIQGVTTMLKLREGYNRVKEMVAKIYQRGGVRTLINNFRDVEDKKEKKEKTVSTCPKPRIPVNGKCSVDFPVKRKNPQGFDCCYKKGKAASKSKSKNSNNVRLVLDPKGGLKIGTKQCMRYSKSSLVNIAKNQGIVNITKKDRKEDICAKLVNKLGIVQYAPFTHNGKEYVMAGEKNTFRIGRRICKTYDIKLLREFAKKMNIPFTSSTKRPELCKLIENARVKLPSPKNTPPPQPKKRGRPRKEQPKTKSKSKSANTKSANRNLANSLERLLMKNMIINKSKSKSKSKSKNNNVRPTVLGARARVEKL